jgi:hypothetical protein
MPKVDISRLAWFAKRRERMAVLSYFATIWKNKNTSFFVQSYADLSMVGGWQSQQRRGLGERKSEI